MVTIVTAFALVSLVVTLTTHVCAHFGLRSAPLPCTLHPGVSILKPLCGADDDLYENLASFTRIAYPRFQIVFGAASPDDPALVVARRVQAENPDRTITVVAGAGPFGGNPKVTNLASLSEHAAHPLWLISDSNVRVDPNYLSAMVADLLQPRVGLVISAFAGRGERSFGARLENLHLNSWILSSMWAMQILTGEGCGMGKSMLFHRRVLDRVGGWGALRDVLAEDFVFGRRVVAAGLSVRTCRQLITTVNTHGNVGRFLSRQIRWSTLRRRLAPVAYLCEPLLNPLLGAAALVMVGAPIAAMGVVAAKLGSEVLLSTRVRHQTPRLRDLAAMLVKDALLAGVWMLGLFRRRVWWRGTWIRIGSGSLISGSEDRVLAKSAAATVRVSRA